jgi:lipopolysaccharide biosynthesis glycosyltransferase
MTIRALVNKGYLELRDEAICPADVAVVFAFDSSYLVQFKVILASLAFSSNFVDAPIVIYTDDPIVASDPIVKIACDKVSLLSGEKRALLYRLAKDHVKREERSSWNRGTFLKWAVFEKHETPRVVFFDVDMIFLKKIDFQIVNCSTAPFNAVPQFQNMLYKNTTSNAFLPSEEVFDNLNNAIMGKFKGRMLHRINSGLMYLQGDMLSNSFFETITMYAETLGRTINEQSIFSEYFKQHRSKVAFIPAAFNFQESYIHRASQEDRAKILSKIGILHFAGQNKPWNILPLIDKDGATLTKALWHWHRTFAEKLLK